MSSKDLWSFLLGYYLEVNLGFISCRLIPEPQNLNFKIE